MRWFLICCARVFVHCTDCMCVFVLGDYFGILMDQKVTSFPFNVTENPMYWGSTANYLGLALM